MLQIFRAGPSFSPKYFIIISEVSSSRALPALKELILCNNLYQEQQQFTVNFVAPKVLHMGPEGWIKIGDV